MNPELDAQEKLRIAILKILAKTDLKLFGCLIYKFDLRIVEGEETAYCYIDRVSKKPNINFCRSFVDIKLPKTTDVVFVILHEMLHFIDGHCSQYRVRNLDRKIYNLAADHVINCMLRHDSNNSLKGAITLPDWVFTVKELEDQDVTLMEVYEYLMNKQQKVEFRIRMPGTPPPQKQNGQGDPSDQGQKGEGGDETQSGQGQGQEPAEAGDTGTLVDVYIDGKYQGTVPFDIGGKDPNASGNDPSDTLNDSALSDELKSEIRSIINNVLKGKSKGNGSGKVMEYLEEVTKLEVPWDVLLENTIQTTRVKSNNNKSWKSIRKKYRHLGVTLPDNSKELVQDNLYIIQDTSGSMGTEEQQKFADLIQQSINYFKAIKVIQHDYDIQNILELDRDNFELQKHKIFEIYGRGGTSHKPSFDYIEDQFFNEDEAIGLIVLCTDYESDVERIWNSYDFHKFVPVKVLCTEKRSIISRDVDDKPIYC